MSNFKIRWVCSVRPFEITSMVNLSIVWYKAQLEISCINNKFWDEVLLRTSFEWKSVVFKINFKNFREFICRKKHKQASRESITKSNQQWEFFIDMITGNHLIYGFLVSGAYHMLWCCSEAALVVFVIYSYSHHVSGIVCPFKIDIQSTCCKQTTIKSFLLKRSVHLCH